MLLFRKATNLVAHTKENHGDNLGNFPTKNIFLKIFNALGETVVHFKNTNDFKCWKDNVEKKSR